MHNDVQGCQKAPATGDIAGYFFSCAGYSSSVKKKQKTEGKKKGFESTETKNEVPHIVGSTVVFCISEHFSMIFTRCNPMPADMTRRKMIACCFPCANQISLFSEFLEFADAWYLYGASLNN